MKKTQIKNGLTVISENTSGSKSTTISVFVGAGSYHENKYPKGIAHFIEHLMFKGTKNRTYKEINEHIDQIGGVLNAYTTYERTKYYCMVPFDQWKIGTDILMDMMTNYTIPIDEFEKERNVILEEIKMYEDDPASLSMDLMNEFIHSDYTERQSILGSPESILSTSREDVLRFLKNYYFPKNMVIVATGNIDHEQLVEYVETFSFYHSSDSIEPIPNFDIQTINDKHFVERDVQQSHICFGSFGPSVYDNDVFTMKVIANLLGGSSSSRLYQSIREDNGLAYSVSLSYSPTSDSGVLEGYVGTEKENIEQVTEMIIRELTDLKINMISDEELQRAVNFTAGIFMLSIDNHSSLNEFYGSNHLLHLPLDIDQYINNIKNVTSHDILRVANKYFHENNLLFVNVVSKD